MAIDYKQWCEQNADVRSLVRALKSSMPDQVVVTDFITTTFLLPFAISARIIKTTEFRKKSGGFLTFFGFICR